MKLLSFMCVLLFAYPAVAEEPYTQLYKLPVPEKCNVEDEEKWCIDLDDWKTIVLMANDYRGLFMWRLEISGALDAHEDVIMGYDLKVQALENSLSILQKERDYKNTRIEELESYFRQGNREHKLEKCLMWGVILVETIAIGALGISGFAHTVNN